MDGIEAVKHVENMIEEIETIMSNFPDKTLLNKMEKDIEALKKVISHANHDIYC